MNGTCRNDSYPPTHPTTERADTVSARTFIGLDGGGTKTRAVLIDGCAREIARATSGPSNYHAIGETATQASLQASLHQVLDQDAVAAALPEIPERNRIAEPVPRNTAPCIGWIHCQP